MNTIKVEKCNSSFSDLPLVDEYFKTSIVKITTYSKSKKKGHRSRNAISFATLTICFFAPFSPVRLFLTFSTWVVDNLQQHLGKTNGVYTK